MANSGLKIITRLRKFVDGSPTDQTKVNAVGDPDYVEPFIDETLCDLTDTAPVPVPAAPVPQPVPVAPTPTYKTFYISTTTYTDANTACAATPGYEKNYHESPSILPVVGTKVYTNTALTATQSAGTYRVQGADNKAYVLGSDGRVLYITNCVAPQPSPVPSPVALAPTPTFNYYWMRTCIGSRDVVVRTTRTHTEGSLNSSTVVSIYGSCYYTYDTASKSDYDERKGDSPSIDVTHFQIFNSCSSCTGGTGQGVPNPVPAPGPTPQPAPVPVPAPVAPVALGTPFQVVHIGFQSAYVLTAGATSSAFDYACRTSPLQTLYYFGSYPGVGAYVTKNPQDPKGTAFDAGATGYRVINLPDGRGLGIRQSDGYIGYIYPRSSFCNPS